MANVLRDSSYLCRARARHWIWTDNKVKKTDYTFNADVVKYAVWQMECGERTGNNHVQGFLSLIKQSSFSSVRSILAASSHIEMAREPKKAAEYCTKVDTRIDGPWTFGTFPFIPTFSSSVDEINKMTLEDEFKTIDQMIQAGADELTIMRNNIRLYRKFRSEIRVLINARNKEIMAKASENPTEPNKVIVLIGDSGTGKSTLYASLCKERDKKAFYYDGGKWFDGYDSYIHSSLFIDEVTTGSVSFTSLNKIIDGRMKIQQVKGSAVELNVDEIGLLSNYKVEQLFRRTQTVVERAFRRRISFLSVFAEINGRVNLHLQLRDTRKPDTAPPDFEMTFKYNKENSFVFSKALANFLVQVESINNYISIPSDMLTRCTKKLEELSNLTEETVLANSQSEIPIDTPCSASDDSGRCPNHPPLPKERNE
jgi:hypothetical protein